MNKTLATTLMVAALGLSACATTQEPITDQNYGGKVSGTQSTSAQAATRFRGCPDWAPKMYRGDLYCLDNYSY